MAALFLYQQSRGGIIDVEAEENKLLLVTEESPSEGACSEPVAPPAPRVASPGPSPSQSHNHNHGRSVPKAKGHRGHHRANRYRGPHRHASNS